MRPYAHVSIGARGPVPKWGGWSRGLLVLIMFVSTLAHMGTSASAQSTGQLRFRFEPDRGMEYVLDGRYRMNDRELKLMEGEHRFVFWAPERLLLDTTLRVEPDRTVDILVRLRYSPDFVDYRRSLDRFERDRKWGLIAPPIVTAGAAVWMVAAFVNYSDAHKELDARANTYTTSSDPAGITALKEVELPAAKDDLRTARTQAYVATGVFAASLVGTLWLRSKLMHKPAPIFEDKERVRFEGLVHVPDANGGTWCATLALPIR